jgi:hypothetical protein
VELGIVPGQELVGGLLWYMVVEENGARHWELVQESSVLGVCVCVLLSKYVEICKCNVTGFISVRFVYYSGLTYILYMFVLAMECLNTEGDIIFKDTLCMTGMGFREVGKHNVVYRCEALVQPLSSVSSVFAIHVYDVSVILW